MEIDKDRIEYVKYRLETAAEDLQTAKLLYDNQRYKPSLNRIYYSIFHAMRAVMAIEGIDFKHHSGVISYFMKEYIKTNIFDKSYSKTIQRASMLRNSSDYEDFYPVSQDETLEIYDEAKLFLDAVEQYISTTLK